MSEEVTDSAVTVPKVNVFSIDMNATLAFGFLIALLFRNWSYHHRILVWVRAADICNSIDVRLRKRRWHAVVQFLCLRGFILHILLYRKAATES